MTSAGHVISHIWCHTSLLLGLLGNSYVLHATIVYKAIKLDKLSVWIIQNLAVSDLISSVIVLIPVLISLYADSSWVLGDTFCKISFGYKYVGIVANMALINILSFNKLARCLFPLKTLHCSRTQKKIVTVTTVILSLLIPAYHLYLSTLKNISLIQFSKPQCMCWMIYISEPYAWIVIADYISAGVLNALPCISLIVVNTVLICFAIKKSTRSIKKGNIFLVVFITASFLVAMLPYFVNFILDGDLSTDDGGVLRFVTFIFFFAFWSNPIVYLATNRHFWRFTVKCCKRNKNRVSVR